MNMMTNSAGMSLTKPSTNGGECAFRLALVTLHNIRAVLDNDHIFIPKWLLDFLDKNGKKGFLNCKDICDSFGINKLCEFWTTIFTVGIPSNFIHVQTDKVLTEQSPNAHINIRVTSDINYIQTTITGQKLLTDLSLLNIQHAGKYMLYNNQYKKYLDKIFIQKQNFCYKYYIQQCDMLRDNLISNGINKYYAKYALNNILDNFLDTDMKCDNDNISLNVLMEQIDLDKFLANEKLTLVINNNFECTEQDEMLHTFEILTDRHDMWVLDDFRLQCQYKGCECVFSRYKRKHHCRACGEIFCSKHWNKCIFKRNKGLDHNISEQQDEKCIKVCTECEQFYWFFAYQLYIVSCDV